jgi:hypothetical protein
VRRTKARRRFRRAAVAAALATTSSEAVRLRERSNMGSLVLLVVWLAPLLLSIALSMYIAREAAAAVPEQSSSAIESVAVVVMLVVIIVAGSLALRTYGTVCTV